MSRLGDLIRTERIRQKMTPKQVARKCGVSESYIVAVEKEVPIPAEPEMKLDTEAKYVIYTDETHTIKGSIGYEVDSFKVKYVNGKEVERTPLFHDSYAPTPTVIYTGVSERPLN